MSRGEQLPARARAWVLSRVAGATAVQSEEPLTGGLSADTRLLVVERSDAPPVQVVLKRFVEVSPSSCVAWEADTLAELADAGLPYGVARVLGRDDEGTDCDVPALLTSRVRGRIAIEADAWEPRVQGLGEALATFHALALPGAPSLPSYRHERRRRKAIPCDPSLPDWAAVWRFVEAHEFEGERLLHGDYHLGNALFEDGRLTGIIDWASARRGPPELDVSYCRVDLSMLLGGDAPDHFLAAYESTARSKVRDIARWDLESSVRAFPDPVAWLPGWVAAGRDDLTPSRIRARLRKFVDGALRRA